MKYLIAFAVIAVAVAVEEVKVVRLPSAPVPAVESRPDLGRLIVPQYVLDALKAQVSEKEDILRVNFVDAPVDMGFKADVPEENVVFYATFAEEDANNALPVSDNEDIFRVNVVDAPVDMDFKADVPEENVVYYATFAEEDASNALPVSDNEDIFRVNVVDAPIELDDSKAPEPVMTYDATFAEETNDESFVVEQVKVADIPLAESQDESNAPEDNLTVKVVHLATVAQDTEADTDPADDDSLKVSFVDSADQAEPIEAVRIAEPVIENEAPTVEAIKIVDRLRLGQLFVDPRLR